MILMGVDVGGVKTNVSLLLADQYSEVVSRIRVIQIEEPVAIDRTLTIQYIYNVF